MHPRRLAWLYGAPQNSQSIEPKLPGQVIASGVVASNGGSGTNEDEIYVRVPDLLPIFKRPVEFVVSEELAGTLQVRFVARQPFASGFGRAPKAICRIEGTALASVL
jgi:hypothetical protein